MVHNAPRYPTSLFSPGSTRSASVSAAARRGASMAQILGAGDWSNLGTYQHYYDSTVDDTPVGRLILEAAVSFFVYFLCFSLWLGFSKL